MILKVVLLSIGAGLGVASCASPPPSSAATLKSTTLIRLSTGLQGGGFFPFGEELAASMHGKIDNVEIQAVASLGGIANMHAIQRGETDLAFTFADVAYMGFVGRLGDNTDPMDQVRGIAVLQVSPLALAARSGARIHTPADLRGQRVSVGPVGSATAFTANLILEAFGLNSQTVSVETIGFQEAADRLLKGTLDAMFDNAVIQSNAITKAINGWDPLESTCRHASLSIL